MNNLNDMESSVVSSSGRPRRVGLNCTDRHRSPQIPQITQIQITDGTDHSEMAQMALNLSNMVQGCQINTLMSLWHPLEQFKRYSLHQQYIYTIFHAKGTSSSNLLLVPANSRPSNKNVSSKDQNTKDMVLGSLRMTPTSLWQP